MNTAKIFQLASEIEKYEQELNSHFEEFRRQYKQISENKELSNEEIMNLVHQNCETGEAAVQEVMEKVLATLAQLKDCVDEETYKNVVNKIIYGEET